jgi:peptide/nickel transport system substrate-binding protein
MEVSKVFSSMKDVRIVRALLIGLMLAVLVLGLQPVFGGNAVPNPNTIVKLTEEHITLDPAAASSTVDLQKLINIYEVLVWYDGSDPNKLMPWLAEEVPSFENGLISSDGLNFTFHIRKGVKFHDGSELTAEDVKYSFDRILMMAFSGNYTYRFITGYLSPETISVIDQYTVRFTLLKPMPSFLRVLTVSTSGIVSKAYVEAHGGITPKQENAWMKSHTLGTGPFMLEEFVPNERLVLKRFDGYWRDPAKSERITFLPVADVNTKILMLTTGEADIIDMEGRFSWYDELKAIPGVVVNEGQPRFNGDFVALNFNIDTKNMLPSDTIPSDFFTDINVRYGFIYAFPYEQYMSTVHAHGNTRYIGPIPPGMLGDNPDLPLWNQDFAKAESYFRKTQWWDKGFTITFVALEGWTDFEKALLMFKDALETLNPKFHVNVQVMAVSDMIAKIYAQPSSPLPVYYWGVTCKFNDPDSLARPLLHSQGSQAKAVGYKNAAVDRLIEEAFSTYDEKARAEYYREMETVAYDDPPNIWVDVETSFDVMRDWVKGFSSNPVYDGWYLYTVYKE